MKDKPDSANKPATPIEHVELIEGETLRADEIARMCQVSTDWVMARVEQEILQARWHEGACYFSSATVWRARQIADIEATYEADPQLAALVADLTEELRQLRLKLALLDR